MDGVSRLLEKSCPSTSVGHHKRTETEMIWREPRLKAYDLFGNNRAINTGFSASAQQVVQNQHAIKF